MLTNHYNTLSKPISPNYVASPRQRIAMPLNYGENSFVAKVRLFCKLTIKANSYFEVLGEKPPIKKLTEVN